MTTEFEILPFSAEWERIESPFAAEAWFGDGEQAERGMRPPRGAGGKARAAAAGGGGRPPGRGGGGGVGKGKGRGGARGKPGAMGGPGSRRPRRWPYPYGWPAGVVMVEPDWLAAGNAPAADWSAGADDGGFDAGDDNDGGMDNGDGAGEW